MYAAAAAKSFQSCPTLCNPIDSSPPGSPVPGILQARTLEWVAISFSNAWKWKVKVKSLSQVQLFVTTWTAAYQAPPPMGFSRQEHWSGCHRLLPSSMYTTQAKTDSCIATQQLSKSENQSWHGPTIQSIIHTPCRFRHSLNSVQFVLLAKELLQKFIVLVNSSHHSPSAWNSGLDFLCPFSNSF